MASSTSPDFAQRLLALGLVTVLLLPGMTGSGITTLVSANHLQMRTHAVSNFAVTVQVGNYRR